MTTSASISLCFLSLMALLGANPSFVAAFVAPRTVSIAGTKTCISSSYLAAGIQNKEEEIMPSSSTASLSRRDALQQWGAVALSSLLLQNVSPAEASVPKNIVMTGANSGLGYQAALLLAGQGHNLILACRTLTKSLDTVKRLKSELAANNIAGSLIAAECDLASLESIRSFAKTIEGEKLDVVCLNAGLSRNTEAKDVLRTKEGFELTVGTNHFGHFYLNHLLLPLIQPSGKIVVTASGVHDPASPGGAQGVPATLGDLEGLTRDGPNFSMVDGNEFNADKAYKDSKLCNVLFTRELQKRLDASSSLASGITANCFNPGLIVSTGLFRDQNHLFVKVFDFAATGLFRVGETPVWGGAALAYMTTVGGGDKSKSSSKGEYYTSPPGSSKYGNDAFGNQFKISDVSTEAQDDGKAKRFWELSEKLVGITSG